MLLTGVGTRAWLDVADQVCGARDAFVEALRRVKVAVRGPKPLAVLRELQVPAWVAAPEPNTWRDLVASLDAAGSDVLRGARVAVQEYGMSNTDFLQELTARGGAVTRVPVYQWQLPEDLEPLREGISRLAAGDIDVALVTTGTQIVHSDAGGGLDGTWRCGARAGCAARSWRRSVRRRRRNCGGTASSPGSKPRIRKWAFW